MQKDAIMNIEKQILHKWHHLPLEKQHEVLDFVDFLVNKITLSTNFT